MNSLFTAPSKGFRYGANVNQSKLLMMVLAGFVLTLIFALKARSNGAKLHSVEGLLAESASTITKLKEELKIMEAKYQTSQKSLEEEVGKSWTYIHQNTDLLKKLEANTKQSEELEKELTDEQNRISQMMVSLHKLHDETKKDAPTA